MAISTALPDLSVFARRAFIKRPFVQQVFLQNRCRGFCQRRMVEVRDTIVLNDMEQELYGTLLAATKHSNTNTVLRAAGGWVRDKLLGKDSVDIDIALDNMMGKEFAERVNDYLASVGKETHRSAVIQSNPDQSKHLETARMKITSLWIDLVNLRSETYAQDSRIPTMEFGTPMQDAMRRDFTINSMFYNINEGVVEDFTGKGMDDLRAGIIRTPLPATETFLDDPLRVLRAVRFGTRFGFELESSLQEAAASDQVREALGSKVSRERVGTEVEGMFHGARPVDAALLLYRLRLFPVVYCLPAALEAQVGLQFGQPCVTAMAAAHALLVARELELDKEERRLYLLAALLLPLRHLTYKGAKGKPFTATYHIIREALKWRAKDVDLVTALHCEAEALQSTHQRLKAAGTGGAADVQPDVRVALGQSIRKLKQHWRLGMMLASVLDVGAAHPLGDEASGGGGSGGASGSSSDGQLVVEESAEATQGRVEMSAELEAAAVALGLEDCWQWKPLLDGKQIMSVLQLKKSGPEVAKYINALVEWQLAQPTGSAEEAQQWLQQQHQQQQQHSTSSSSLPAV